MVDEFFLMSILKNIKHVCIFLLNVLTAEFLVSFDILFQCVIAISGSNQYSYPKQIEGFICRPRICTSVKIRQFLLFFSHFLCDVIKSFPKILFC
jgi:hypothetical protein